MADTTIGDDTAQVEDAVVELRPTVKPQLEVTRSTPSVDPGSLVRFSPDLPEILTTEERQSLSRRAAELEPWQQGPFLLGGDLVVGDALRNHQRWIELRREIPSDLGGKRVLDIGSNAGYDPFMFRLHGAEHVLACEPGASHQQALFLESIYRSGVTFDQIGWQELDPRRHGKFDLVHCNDLLHREAHPLLMLQQLRDMLAEDGQAIIGTMMLADPGLSEHVRFVPGPYHDDPSCWWVPGRLAVRWMLESVGLAVECEFGERDGPAGEFPVVTGYFQASPAEAHPGLPRLRR